VTCLKFNTQGTLLASSSADRTAKIWSVEDGKLLHTLVGHKKVLPALWFEEGSISSWRCCEQGLMHLKSVLMCPYCCLGCGLHLLGKATSLSNV